MSLGDAMTTNYYICKAQVNEQFVAKCGAFAERNTMLETMLENKLLFASFTSWAKPFSFLKNNIYFYA